MSKEYVKELLSRNGYFSVSEFARDLGEDVNNVNKIMKGLIKPSIAKALRYGKRLNLSLKDTMELFYPNEMTEFYK